MKIVKFKNGTFGVRRSKLTKGTDEEVSDKGTNFNLDSNIGGAFGTYDGETRADRFIKHFNSR